MRRSCDTIVALLNGTLPKRLQLSDADFVTQLMNFQNIPKRTLLKSTRAAWSAAGLHVPRGKIFPTLEILVRSSKGSRAPMRLKKIEENPSLEIEMRRAV